MMAKRNLWAAVALVSTLAFAAAGCVQMPTEKQSVIDLRPQISFSTNTEEVKAASVLVDGLRMGSVGDYLQGQSSLRVLPGTHSLTVVIANRVLIDQKFYVGDGVSRTFNVQ